MFAGSDNGNDFDVMSDTLDRLDDSNVISRKLSYMISGIKLLNEYSPRFSVFTGSPLISPRAK